MVWQEHDTQVIEGSSSYISNLAGNVSQHIEYMPFGEMLVDEHINSFNTPFKFNGKEYDEETGNYYYGARYYDPKWSIFISVDPLAEQTMSSYGYCYNNPVNLIDPSGMSAYPPATDMETRDGYVYTDADGTWIFDKAENIWRGQDGASDYSNSIGLPTLTMTTPDPYEGTYWDRDNYGKGPNPFSPSTDERFAWAVVGIVALPLALEAFGAQAVGEFLLEEALEEGLEQATGIPVIFNPVDLVENGIKKSAKMSTSLITTGRKWSKHSLDRLAERGITKDMAEATISKGQKFYDPLNNSINYVLPNSFASGKSILIATNPLTGEVATAIRSSKKLVKTRFIPIQ